MHDLLPREEIAKRKTRRERLARKEVATADCANVVAETRALVPLATTCDNFRRPPRTLIDRGVSVFDASPAVLAVPETYVHKASITHHQHAQRYMMNANSRVKLLNCFVFLPGLRVPVYCRRRSISVLSTCSPSYTCTRGIPYLCCRLCMGKCSVPSPSASCQRYRGEAAPSPCHRLCRMASLCLHLHTRLEPSCTRSRSRWNRETCSLECHDPTPWIAGNLEPCTFQDSFSVCSRT